MTPFPRSLSTLLLSLVLAGLPAAAARAGEGIVLVQKTTAGDNTRTHEIQIEKTRMRTESSTPTGEKRTVLFDSSKQTLWLIDDEHKSYIEMTKADAERMGGAVAKLQEQLKGMPAEQREQVEKMMKSRGLPGAAAARTEYRKVGTDKVGGWPCTQYEGTSNGKKILELCAADPKALGFAPADFEVTQKMVEFFAKLVPQGGDRMFSLGTGGGNGFEGVPVRTVILGPPTITSEILKASRQTFPDSTFELPAGFQKQEFGGPRGRGPQQPQQP